MSERRDHTQSVESDADVARLIRRAGRRPAPADEDLEAITAVARAAWEEKAHANRRASSGGPVPWVALAASLLLAVLVGWWWLGRGDVPAAGVTVATVERLEGVVLAGERPLAPENEVGGGTAITTSGGRAALRLVGGQSLRVDSQTSLRLVSPGRVELLQGRIYVDSPPGTSGEVEVSTTLGRVVEIGTQFEVSFDEGVGELAVRVREGAVAVRRDDQSTSAGRGESLVVRGDGSVSRVASSSAPENWAWVLAVAPAPLVDGMSLATFLEWASREIGLPIGYESAELERSVASILLSGEVDGMSPEDALAVMLRGSGLASRVEGERIVVFTYP